MSAPAEPLVAIAAAAGVSPNTVLRVLRGENKEIWPSAARRADEIRRLAREHGYLPHGSARAMRRGRLDCLALLLSVDRGRSHLPEDAFNAIADACDHARQRLVVAKVADDQLGDATRLPRILAEWSCDGVLINYTDRIPAAMPELVARCRIPAVWLNSRHDADAVWYDDRAGAALAVEHLVALGHRRIAWLDFVGDGPGAHYSRGERPAGFATAMAAAGLAAVDLGAVPETPVAERLAATVAMLRRPDRPTAIVAYDGAERLLYAAALAGLRVPEDLSLVVFGPAVDAAERLRQQNHLGRQATTVALPGAEAGRAAVTMLLAKIGRGGAQAPRVLAPALVPGDTSGPVPCGVASR